MQPPSPTNDVVIGQDRAVAALRNALLAGRLAHGLLFTGPVGVGRETCARALARGLLCELRGTPQQLLPFGCGACRACRRVEHGTHPDVTVVMSEAEAVARGLAEPEGKARPSVEIKIDAIRAFAQTLQKRPYEGSNRVAVVVDAHRMNTAAQNALLKGLEEPGPQTILILLAPNARAVLPTIASRCLRLAFAPLSPADQQRVSARSAAAPGAAAGADDAHDGVEQLLTALLLRQNAEGLAQRLEVAAALGRDRAEVDALLAHTERRLASDQRARHLEGLPHSDLDELGALEGLFHARRDLAMNGAVQLVVERLLLGAPASILERR